MKQHITKEQWNELNEKDKAFIIEMFIDSPHSLESMTIGQMIEFLNEPPFAKITWYKPRGFELVFAFGLGGKEYDSNARQFQEKIKNITKEDGFICDTLWEAVKYKLNET